jgi:hypothetical protein
MCRTYVCYGVVVVTDDLPSLDVDGFFGHLDDLTSRLAALTKHAVDLDFGAQSSTDLAIQAERLRRLVHVLTLRAAECCASSRAHAGTGSRNAAEHRANAAGLDSRDARRTQVTAEQLAVLPLVAEAMRNGELSESALAAIASVAVDKPHAQQRLLDAVKRGPAAFRDELRAVKHEGESDRQRATRQREARSLTMSTDRDGMLSGRFRLEPGRGAELKALLDKRASELWKTQRGDTIEQRNADSLMDLVTGAVTGKVRTTVHLVVDLPALQRGEVGEGERCEIAGVGPVPVSHAVALLGSKAFVTFVVKNGVDIATVAHLGRHVPAHVMTALIAAGRECCIEGCGVCGYVERDHLHEWAKGGLTSFANIEFECSRHHRLKTEGWILGPQDPITGKYRLYPPGTRLDE